MTPPPFGAPPTLSRREEEDGSALLAPEVEAFLNRAVGEGEEDGLALRLVHDPGPARDDEVVALLPMEGLVADRAFALAFDHREHRTVGAAIGRRLEALGQELHEGAHGRHRRAAIGWVHVAQL